MQRKRWRFEGRKANMGRKRYKSMIQVGIQTAKAGEWGSKGKVEMG